MECLKYLYERGPVIQLKTVTCVGGLTEWFPDCVGWSLSSPANTEECTEYTTPEREGEGGQESGGVGEGSGEGGREREGKEGMCYSHLLYTYLHTYATQTECLYTYIHVHTQKKG